MIHKKGYQETDTSIISSITLKVKVRSSSTSEEQQQQQHVFGSLQGIGYNQTAGNKTLVIDGAGKRQVPIEEE